MRPPTTWPGGLGSVMVCLMVKRHIVSRRIRFGSILLFACLLTACGIQVPTDPHDTLNRVQAGMIRVGVTDNRPWVVLDETGNPTGIEPDLVSGFAEELGSEIQWTTGSEATLLNGLERGEFDIVIGGFLEDTPWVEKGAITVPYREETTPDGPQKHVMIVRMGENGFLLALEKFLLQEAGA